LGICAQIYSATKTSNTHELSAVESPETVALVFELNGDSKFLWSTAQPSIISEVASQHQYAGLLRTNITEATAHPALYSHPYCMGLPFGPLAFIPFAALVVADEDMPHALASKELVSLKGVESGNALAREIERLQHKLAEEGAKFMREPKTKLASTNGEFNVYLSYEGYKQADGRYTDMGVAKVGARMLLGDDFVDTLRTDKYEHIGASFAYAGRGIPFPFHVIATLPHASVQLEPEVRAEEGDQCDMRLRIQKEANEEMLKDNEEMLKVKDEVIAENEKMLKEKNEVITGNDKVITEKEEMIKEKEEALQVAQATSRMAMVRRNSRAIRGQQTPARSARRKFRRPLAVISSPLQLLRVPAWIYGEGGVQPWKAQPLVVPVDASSGKNSPSCITSSSSASTTACKTIRYALEHGQIAARKTSAPLELAVSPGVYLGECSEDGNAINIPTAIKKAGGRAGAVRIDCEKKGKAFNVTQAPTSTFHLEGLAIVNGTSAMGGAAFVEGGRMVLKDCAFADLESLASSAGNVFMGGGGFMFVVSRALVGVVVCTRNRN
jgi:hypothetical protein